MTSYTKQDTIDTLSIEQLSLMVKSDFGILVDYIEMNTHFDAHRVRLLLEMGQHEALNRLQKANNQ